MKFLSFFQTSLQLTNVDRLRLSVDTCWYALLWYSATLFIVDVHLLTSFFSASMHVPFS